MKPYIFRSEPLLVPKVWGGTRLSTLCGKGKQSEVPIGESWEVADLEEGQSRVATGPLKGMTLRDLGERWKSGLVGTEAESTRFPLLVKLLDAHRDLSVQVHPGKQDLPTLPGAASKEESWIIVESREGRIIHGLRQDGVSRGEFRDALDSGVIEELLESRPVIAGDVVHIPPGMIHAIGEGVVLLEIQEPSDTTYRVFDYNRPGLDGRPRPLHIEEALRVANLGVSPQKCFAAANQRQNSGKNYWIETESYRLERYSFGTGWSDSWEIDPRSPQVIHLLTGRLVLEDGLGGELIMESFDTAVVPAALERLHARGEGEVEFVLAGRALARDLGPGPVTLEEIESLET